ncbi:regulatory-associated protein of mTOR isoform X1 [Patella vulgata]|uniref:regulatory-associated protein of mTOR isoform X1 n=1 Tax=Patella vulgata TaxID=6465 RepID=UPI00218072F5|nr:regulatory-associated protein of mTOR isoform X1 [Patella vulgata]
MTAESPLSPYEDGEIDPQVWQLPVALNEARHCESITGCNSLAQHAQSWRMKERMKTVSVALVLCLNVGVDPPDIVKTSPCARLECWIDPLSMNGQKALETIGAQLQKQYERWQPRARYKQSLDPTVEEVKKLCTSLRRNAKEERVLFHYNGHGVPRPTINGEIWVFNKNYTQYIPLSIYDLQTWMGSPSIYVYDCSNAMMIVDSFKQFATQREQEQESTTVNGGHWSGSGSNTTKHCIQLAACGANELLPMNPDLPADLFSSCLTTPIKIALKWYVLQNTSKLVPGLTLEMVDKIPGQLNDRRTMLGELNWIFTAITDTIAWNTLPRELFQKLFRQDLLVASLFRNFLLAERIMRSYNCTPASSPKLPPTYQHPMWQAWDLALDLCLRQLPQKGDDDGAVVAHSPFFAEQLTAFQVWLSYGYEERRPPEQLPIVLQVLLSQVHRLRALDLLGKFLDLGPWAVSLALSVGIFPYVLKLLQSSARELRPLLVFIWAKILAVDSSCQADLVKDNGHKYFLSVLSDSYMPADHRTMAAFVLSMIVNDYRQGQEAALQGSVISICLEQITDSNPRFRQWLALCLGKVWINFDNARWCGVRDSAHEKLYNLLSDPCPEVRAAAVYALGAFISSSSERTDHANNIDLGVGMKLTQVGSDGSPLVRKELAVAFGALVVQFETHFAAVACQVLDDDKKELKHGPMVTSETAGGWNLVNQTDPFLSPFPSNIKRSASRNSLKERGPNSNLSTIFTQSSTTNLEGLDGSLERSRRFSSSTSLAGSAISFNNVYLSVWRTLLQLAMDAHPEVAEMAKAIVNSVKHRASTNAKPKPMQSIQNTNSAPSSPSNKPPVQMIIGTPPQNNGSTMEESKNRDLHSPSRQPGSHPHSVQFPRSRKMFDKGPSHKDDKDDEPPPTKIAGDVCTEFFQWSCSYFAKPVMRLSEEKDPESGLHQERDFRLFRNSRVRQEAREEQTRAGFNRLDDQVFVNRNIGIPSVIKFHPYQSYLAVGDKEGVSIWDWEQGTKLSYLNNENPKHSRITAMDFVNAHDKSLLLCGSDDGAVRIWRKYMEDEGKGKELVTTFQALSDMLPLTRGSGLVTEWEQETGMLISSGDVRIIRIWDTQKELKLQDIPTGADSCVTSLSCDSSGRSLIIAGCGDGTVRLFDRRLAPSECRVMTLQEHGSMVVKVHLQKGTEGKIVSASTGGDIRFWDPRFTESVSNFPTQTSLTSMEVHPRADVIACGALNQSIVVYNQSGDNLSTIKYHEGFLGQRIGTISCLAFHPYFVKLAAGSTDSFVSVYSTPASTRRS